MKWSVWPTLFLFAACSAPAPEIERPTPLLSGSEFITDETRALQEDDFANPGMIWVERGEAMFSAPAENGQSCASCHSPQDLTRAAATHPKVWAGDVATLSKRIEICQTQELGAPPLTPDETLALESYVSFLGRSTPISLDLSLPKMKAALQRGQDYYFTRRGQMNLSCAQCHDEAWGGRLRGDTISQGHPNGFPAYRFEWQNMGGLHQRLADCDRGVRAEPFAPGGLEYTDLEVYLRARAEGLPLESPAVRR